jgi:hypothetical protein
MKIYSKFRLGDELSMSSYYSLKIQYSFNLTKHKKESFQFLYFIPFTLVVGLSIETLLVTSFTIGAELTT